jgi:hypothetical protein
MEPLMYRSLFFAAAAVVALPASEAAAEVPLTGFFIARETCPALQSIRNATNPGEVKTEPGKSYPMIAKNKPNASHYFIEVEGADPARRWVAVDAASMSSPPMGQASRKCLGPTKTGTATHRVPNTSFRSVGNRPSAKRSAIKRNAQPKLLTVSTPRISRCMAFGHSQGAMHIATCRRK